MQRFDLNKFRFDKDGLIPAVVQDSRSGKVFMVAFMNQESIRKTMETGETHFWSRSRKELWHKGETSGNVQKVRSIVADCDYDALLLRVDQTGSACHTGEYSCFFNTFFEGERQGPPIVEAFASLWNTIQQRKIEQPSNSYTTHLFQSGPDKVLKKIAEEAGETIIAAKNHDRSEVAWEASDLLYHLLVLLAMEEVSLDDIAMELERRATARGRKEQ
jgi:phosphoribosyl-ATP pyrophosphohydrolase/phosphoribosyl-AMP cyclohydrolase